MAHNLKLSDYTVGQEVVIGGFSPFHAGIHPLQCNSMQFPDRPCRSTVLSVGHKWLTVSMNGRKIRVCAPADADSCMKYTAFPVDEGKRLYHIAMLHNGGCPVHAARCVEGL